MSGILDNKSRVIDAILTFEGRRQIADGNFTVKYVTFSDAPVFYQKDLEQGHVDPTNKIYLECFNKPQDQITFEADDSGNLSPFRQHEYIGYNAVQGLTTSSVAWTTFYQGKLKNNLKSYSFTSGITGSYVEVPLKGQNFASQIEGILTSSYDNFKNLNILGSEDVIFEDQNFALSSNEISFTIASNKETLQMQDPTNVNTIDSLFSDEKLRNVENFMYLPPIKKVTNTTLDKTDITNLKNNNYFLGNYPPWGPTERLTFADIKRSLLPYESTAKTVVFDPTSRDNDIVAQFFEINYDSVKKLDVIDYGKVNSISNAETYHIFFVGKVLIDDTGSNCFVHLFTLIFEPEEET